MLKADLESVFGEISDLHPIAQGEDSKTYGFHQKGNRYVLRIKRLIAGFEKDAFVSRKFATPFLPIPEIVSIGRFPNDNAYCISRRAEGVTLQDLSPSELPSVLPPVSWVMEAIAASNISETVGFGPFDSTGTGRYTSWRDFILEPQQYSLATTRPYLDRIERWIENCPGNPPTRSWRLRFQ